MISSSTHERLQMSRESAIYIYTIVLFSGMFRLDDFFFLGYTVCLLRLWTTVVLMRMAASKVTKKYDAAAGLADKKQAARGRSNRKEDQASLLDYFDSVFFITIRSFATAQSCATVINNLLY